MKKKNISLMASFPSEEIVPVLEKYLPFLFTWMVPDKEKIFPDQKIYLYEKKGDGEGRGKVVGEATIVEMTDISEMYFPQTQLMLYWAKNVEEDMDLVERIQAIGDFRLPSYKDDFTFIVGLYDEEYLKYMKEHNALPPSYNDLYHDYQTHPEHGAAREKANLVLRAFDCWLYSIGLYDDYGGKVKNAIIKVKNPKAYKAPKDVSDFRAEIRMKTLTRPPQGIMYTWDGTSR